MQVIRYLGMCCLFLIWENLTVAYLYLAEKIMAAVFKMASESKVRTGRLFPWKSTCQMELRYLLNWALSAFCFQLLTLLYLGLLERMLHSRSLPHGAVCRLISADFMLPLQICRSPLGSRLTNPINIASLSPVFHRLDQGIQSRAEHSAAIPPVPAVLRFLLRAQGLLPVLSWFSCSAPQMPSSLLLPWGCICLWAAWRLAFKGSP